MAEDRQQRGEALDRWLAAEGGVFGSSSLFRDLFLCSGVRVPEFNASCSDTARGRVESPASPYLKIDLAPATVASLHTKSSGFCKE